MTSAIRIRSGENFRCLSRASGAVERVDETAFVQLAENARIHNIFDLDCRHLRVRSRKDASDVEKTISRRIWLSLEVLQTCLIGFLGTSSIHPKALRQCLDGRLSIAWVVDEGQRSYKAFQHSFDKLRRLINRFLKSNEAGASKGNVGFPQL